MTSPDDEVIGSSVRDQSATRRAQSVSNDSLSDQVFMHEVMKSFAEHNVNPDVGFSMIEEPSRDVAERAAELSHRIARDLAAHGPPGWKRLEAVFAITVVAEVAVVVFSDDRQHAVVTQAAEAVLPLVREHRELSSRLSDGPWWRLLLSLDNAGAVEVDYDYGDDPFPVDQLFPPEAYRADLEVYPREAIPVWLAAYIRQSDQQSRTPQEAAARSRADRDAGTSAIRSERDFPDLPVMWARWAVMAAAFVATGSQWGPRVLPALGWFEGSHRSGSTLYMLPGGRAVLSGGVWDAPELNAVYNGGESMPGLYDGAPEWVANPVLNPRAAEGLLSFCYWWESGHWYHGESPAADQISDAVPGIWSAETVAAVVAGLVADQPTDQQLAAVATLVSAAEAGVVTRGALVDVFGDSGTFDYDSALFQLTMAGVALTAPESMLEQEAIARVREFIEGSDMDVSGYPLDQLRADRFSVGWMIYVPTQRSEIAIGRAIFYIGDDGVLEQSSSSVAPSVYIAEFEQRFRQRNG